MYVYVQVRLRFILHMPDVLRFRKKCIRSCEFVFYQWWRRNGLSQKLQYTKKNIIIGINADMFPVLASCCQFVW